METERYIEEFLKKRGYRSREEMQKLFDFEEASLRRVADMVNGETLLAKLKIAVETRENIVIYGDYDADGIMASFILYSGLERLVPGRVKIFINNRFEDGYNITPESIRKLMALYPQTGLILTCDNGIGAAEAYLTLRETGVTVLVTDHHEQGCPLPEHIAGVDEKSIAQKAADADAGVAREEFCGAELARRVISELYERLETAEAERDFLASLYAYAGFATITDSVPMNPANHYIASRGLEVMREDQGFFAILKRETGNAARRTDAYTVGFLYGPLFNAAGRVSGTAKNALAAPVLFSMGYEKECAQTVRGLIALNEQRKEMCRREDALASSMIEENGWERSPFILLSDEAFSEGINGLTAAHIVSRYGVPAAVLSPVRGDGETFKGSARSREGFDLFRAFSSHPEYIRAGGHPLAAGLSVRARDIEAVRALLCADASGIAYQDPENDFTFTPKELTLDEVENMQRAFRELEPFGPGLEAPRIAVRGAVGPIRVLKEVHAKFTMCERAGDGHLIEMIWWNHRKEAEELSGAGTEWMFIGEPSVHEFNGRCSIQFKVNEAYPV